MNNICAMLGPSFRDIQCNQLLQALTTCSRNPWSQRRVLAGPLLCAAKNSLTRHTAYRPPGSNEVLEFPPKLGRKRVRLEPETGRQANLRYSEYGSLGGSGPFERGSTSFGSRTVTGERVRNWHQPSGFRAKGARGLERMERKINLRL
ncbi:hypothetical protein B0H16DRAFT_1460460 [Mycena metata]|uniref:Uncharacterized protein n=1 Tax=Mycena metata TaxID=1033252 RepID=A0AAD7IV66_9AGAR|nr:hypothetical protein B0H16DRAFT_1460460 [Mycena metata]